ncbi:MAG: membrane protein insertase YidC [Actinobacteria bacterium]|nr:membrane protein insertase YidC [Actinomycetota bacterium]
MIAIEFFQQPARLLNWFYTLTHDYILSISMIALVVMLVTSPLVLKSTKGMLEMQKLQPEMKKLQNLHRGDRQKLNEEMMKLYQEHKVNPLASCLPLLLQMPVFIIMFRVLYGLTNRVAGPGSAFAPKYLAKDSELYLSLVGKTEMKSWGIDLSLRPYQALSHGFTKGLVYTGLVAMLCLLYFVQQRMIASRNTATPSMSPTMQKVMQYLPVLFGIFSFFYLTGLAIYYMAQAVFRIGLNYYITFRFYKGEHSLGRVAQRAGEEARELAKKDGGGGGMFAQAKRELNAAKQTKPASGTTVSKRVTPPKNKPTPSSSHSKGRPASTGRAVRPDGSRRVPKKK